MEIQLNPAQFGIEESRAADIAAQFKPMLDKMIELEVEYNDVVALPIEQASIPAKALRLKYVKVRTGTDKIHKDQKAFYLAAGRYVDGWKNAQLFAAQGIEKKLEGIEKYAENKEKERVDSLQAERLAIISKYDVDGSKLEFGKMTYEVFSNFVLGCKTAYDNKKEAERLAEEQREAAIESERIRQEEIRAENERLKKEAEQREAAIQAERAEAARIAKIESDKQAAILKAQQEQADKERAEAAKKLQAEQAASRKIAAELQAKKDAEEKEKQRLAKIEADRITAEKKAAKAPVKEKLRIAIAALSIELPESDITADLIAKFESYKRWALTQIENL